VRKSQAQATHRVGHARTLPSVIWASGVLWVSLDHLVGASSERRRNFESERAATSATRHNERVQPDSVTAFRGRTPFQPTNAALPV